MKITNQQEEDIIQDLLPKMLEQPGHPYPLAEAAPAAYLVVLLNRLTTEGLVSAVDSGTGGSFVRLTTKGVAVARHAGGYKGYLQAETQNQIERDTREQRTAQATLDSVRANWWAVRVSIGGIALSALFSGWSLLRSNDTAADLAAANTEIKVLQQEVINLKAQAATQPAAQAPAPTASPVPATQPAAANPAPAASDDD